MNSCITPSDIREELREYCNLRYIHLFAVDVNYNQEPFVVMSENKVHDVVSYMIGAYKYIFLVLLNFLIICLINRSLQSALFTVLHKWKGNISWPLHFCLNDLYN